MLPTQFCDHIWIVELSEVTDCRISSSQEQDSPPDFDEVKRLFGAQRASFEHVEIALSERPHAEQVALSQGGQDIDQSQDPNELGGHVQSHRPGTHLRIGNSWHTCV